MNILLVSSKYMPEYSGSGFRAHNLYKRLLNNNSEINLTVLCGSQSFNDIKNYEYDGINVQRIACKKHLKIEKGLKRRLQTASNFSAESKATISFLNNFSGKIDIVHVFGKNNVTATVLDYARKNKIPAIIELCNEMKTPLQYVPLINKLSVSDKLPEKYLFVCISEMLAAMCRRNSVPEENIWCRPNPVNELEFHPVTKEEKFNLRSELTNFNKNDIVITYIAKFRKSKNHQFLIEVLKHLSPEYKLIVGGPVVENGPEKDISNSLLNILKESIEGTELQKRVQIFPGFIDNVSDFYKMSDVYAFPTSQEALGTPMLEAVACGVPVVANRLPGVSDVWIKNGKNGYLSELNPAEFADKIKDAAKFNSEQMNKESETMIKVAGTKIIDSKYLDLIEEISNFCEKGSV